MNVLKYFNENCGVEDRTKLHAACLDHAGGMSVNSLVKIVTGKSWVFVTAKNRYKFKNGVKDFIKNNEDRIICNYYSLGEDTANGHYFDDDIYVSFQVDDSTDSMKDNIYIYTNGVGNSHLAQKFIDEHLRELKRKSQSFIHLLQHNPQDGYYLTDYAIKDVKDLDLGLNYNDDFVGIHDKLMHILKNDEKSMSIFHGLPGCGKTTYLRYLIALLANTNSERKVIYLPPNMTQVLSNPDFISSLGLFKDSVVIIEDAEGVLTENGNRSQAISNILNITDGILADLFNIHFIFTFNIDIKKIDPALLRKGRLTLKYEFKKLSYDKVVKLCETIGTISHNDGMTLADIYNSEDNGVILKSNNKIGF